MMGLTRVQADCLAFVKNQIRERGVAPTVEETRAYMGFANKGATARVIQRLEERGHLVRFSNRKRDLRVVTDGYCNPPIFGNVRKTDWNQASAQHLRMIDALKWTVDLSGVVQVGIREFHPKIEGR